MHLEIEEINKTSLRKEHIKYFEIFRKLKRKRIFFDIRNIQYIICTVQNNVSIQISNIFIQRISHPSSPSTKQKKRQNIYIYVRKNIRKKYSHEGGGRTSRGNGKFIRRFNRRSRD